MRKLLVFILIFPGLLFADEKVTLNQCRQLALKHNKKIQIAQKNRNAVGLNRKAAFTHFLPSLNFVSNYTYLNKLPAFDTPELTVPIQDMSSGQPIQSPYLFFLPPQHIEIGQNNIYLMNVGLIQPLFTGGKIVQQYKIHCYLEEMAVSNQQLETSEVLYTTDKLYWQVVSLKEKVILAQKYKEMIHKHLRDLQNYLDEGIITKNDLLKAQVKYNEAELKLFKAQNGLQLAKMALNQTIGLPLDTDIQTTDELYDKYGSINHNLKNNPTFQNRPELKMLQNLVQISESNVKLNRSRYLPNVLLQANYHYSNPNLYNSMKNEFEGDWNIGITLQFELFHWNERGWKLSSAKLQRQSSKLKLAEAKELINLEVQQAVFKLNESLQKIRMTTLALEQANENLKVTEENFKEGIVSNTEVLDAQTLWQQSYSENIDAKAEYKQNQTVLEKALGILSEQGKGE